MCPSFQGPWPLEFEKVNTGKLVFFNTPLWGGGGGGGGIIAIES